MHLQKVRKVFLVTRSHIVAQTSIQCHFSAGPINIVKVLEKYATRNNNLLIFAAGGRGQAKSEAFEFIFNLCCANLMNAACLIIPFQASLFSTRAFLCRN